MDVPERQGAYEAEFELEIPVSCPHCRQTISTLNVVRLLRTRVNFTSTVPRRGFLTLCPSCSGVLPASIGGRVA